MMLARTLTAIRRNAIAWLALFVAMTGTSIAAGHYIITSSHQIKPSVLKQLRGSRGTSGSQGPQGPQGKEGPSGPAGGPTGPKGNTGLQGEPGPKGDSVEGKEGKQGPEGKEGKEGKAGTALAFAHVTSAGIIEAEPHSRNFGTAKVENPRDVADEGVYCISGLGVEPHNVTVTVDNGASQGPFFATATIGKSHYVTEKALCTSATQITVETGGLSAAKVLETLDAPFFIVIN